MKVRIRRVRTARTGLVLFLVGLLVALGGCAPEIEKDELQERVSVLFDSENGFIPLPSNAALEEDGTLPPLPAINDESAEGDLARWLDTVHGWLPVSSIEVPVGGPIDESTLTADAFRVYEFVEGEAPVPLTVDTVTYTPAEETPEGEPAVINVTVEGGFALRSSYGYVMTDAVKDAAGNPLLAPQPIFFAAAETPLLQEDGTPNFSALASLPEEDRQALAGLQQFYAPVIGAAAADGVERVDIIAASMWTTANDTFFLFDPTAGIAPFPISSLVEDGTVNLPTEGQTGIALALLEELNTRTGFSTTASAWLPVAGPIDPASIVPGDRTANPEANVSMALVDGLPSPYDEDRYEVIYRPEMGIIEVAPTSPLAFGAGDSTVTQVLYADESMTDDQGRPVKADLVFVLLRSQYPVADEDGKSLVSLLDDATAAGLQAAKDGGIETLVGLGASLTGYQRETLATGTGFDTQDPTRMLRDMRARAIYAAQEGGELNAEETDRVEDPSDNVGVSVDAEFTGQIFVDASGAISDEPTTEAIPITVTWPSATTNCEAPFNVVILQHGLGSARTVTSGAFADTMSGADYCNATVAMDFPLHGDRAPAGEDSGAGYLSPNLVATKNFMLQSVVDLHVLTEVLLADGLEGLVDADDQTDFFNADGFGFVGTSLGGILGTNFVATSPAVSDAVFTVAGAKFTDILSGDLGGDLIAALPGEDGSFEQFQTLQLVQWAADPVEPWNFAVHTTDDPLPTREYDGAEYSEGDAPEEAEVLVQMAVGDTTVPNSSTERLADALGVTLDDTTFDGVEHGFVNGDTPEGECARLQAAQWVTSGLAGDAELTPALQNACQ